MEQSNYMYRDIVITFGANHPFGFPTKTKASKFYKGLKFTSENYKEIRNVRHTKFWKTQADEFKKGKTCFICGSQSDLQVHHFDNHNYEQISEKNCVVICKGCHFNAFNIIREKLVKGEFDRTGGRY